MKLTAPQKELLNEAGAGNCNCSDTYRPALRLVALGLCEWKSSSFGSTYLVITDAGRAALRDAEEGGE